MLKRRRVLGVSVLFLAVALAAIAPLRASESSAFRAALDSITTSELRSHVEFLADDRLEGREAGTPGGREAGSFLARQMARLGLKPAGLDGGYFQPFGEGYRNVLGVWEGSDPALKGEYVAVGAHYDHLGYGTPSTSRGPLGEIHPGADDNASGVAAVLEAADALRFLPAPRRSILFAFWDGEEIGLLGSEHWVRHPTVPLSRVAVKFNLDMVGRLENEQLTVIGTRSGVGLRQMAARHNTTGLQLLFPWRIEGNSDHTPFFQRDIPVVMLHTGLHDDYHSPRDVAAKINAEGMRRVAKLLVRLMWETANREERIAFRPAARDETDQDRRQLEQPAAALPPRLGVWWDDADRGGPGVLVAKVVAGSAAEQSGLRPGDRVLEADGEPLADGNALRRAVLRGGATLALKVQRPEEAQPIERVVPLGGSPVRLGLSWREDAAEPGAAIVVRVAPGSPAWEAGVRLGDRILEVAGAPLSGSDELLERIESLVGPTELLVERQGRLTRVVADLPALSHPPEEQAHRPAEDSFPQRAETNMAHQATSLEAGSSQ